MSCFGKTKRPSSFRNKTPRLGLQFSGLQFSIFFEQPSVMVSFGLKIIVPLNG